MSPLLQTLENPVTSRFEPLPLCLAVLCLLILGGCGPSYNEFDTSGIVFKDHLSTNDTPGDKTADLQFTDQAGKTVPLKSLFGDKHLVLVITRGYNGQICPYCATQTARLIANYKEFTNRGAEVVLVYPIAQPADEPRLADFTKRALKLDPGAEAAGAVPFPVLLDVNLAAVDALGIRKDLSKPSTYIFDKTGKLHFAYVSSSLTDRPSVKALLEQLDLLKP